MVQSTIKIAVACGSGIATSTIAADAVEDILNKHNISNYKIIKASMTEINDVLQQVDIVLTTNNFKTEEKPHLNIMGFVTGLNEDMLEEQLVGMIKEL